MSANEVLSSLANELPDWEFRESERSFYGTITLEHEGIKCGEYRVKLVLSSDYPASPPLVFELDGKVPRIDDRHINGNGSCCLFVQDETRRFWNETVTLSEFVANTVKSFFVSQRYFDLTGKWLHGDRRHGDLGVIDFYCQELEVKKLRSLVPLLEMCSKKIIKGNWACPCGSGQTLKECHLDNIQKIKNLVPRKRLLEVSTTLKTAILNKPN